MGHGSHLMRTSEQRLYRRNLALGLNWTRSSGLWRRVLVLWDADVSADHTASSYSSPCRFIIPC